jgi:hypothetical protein
MLRVLDRAIRSLGQPQSDYRRALGDARAALVSASDDRVRGALSAFLQRIPTLGADFQCSDEFIRVRAGEMLWRLRDVVLDVQTRPLEPVVCYTVPFAVDLERATPGQVVDLYGYDFDAAPLQLVVITRDGFTDVTSSLTITSHTHATVRVGEGGVPTLAVNESIGIAWGHIIHYRVPLVGPASRLCQPRIETVQPGVTVSYDSVTQVSGLSPVSGADVTAELRLDYSSNALQAALCVTTPDAAESGCVSEFVHMTDPDRVIDGVFGSQSSRVSFSGRRETNVTSSQGLVRQWSLGGRKNASATRVVDARLDGITLVSRDDESCLSPIAYIEAKRTVRFPDATARSLDAQLKGLDPAILRLRPRFAPPR